MSVIFISYGEFFRAYAFNIFSYLGQIALFPRTKNHPKSHLKLENRWLFSVLMILISRFSNMGWAAD